MSQEEMVDGMSDHDPLCEFGEHSPIPVAFHLEPRQCNCDLIAQVREDERNRTKEAVMIQLRHSISLVHAGPPTFSEYLRGQEAAYRHVLSILEELSCTVELDR